MWLLASSQTIKKKNADDECLRSCLRPWIEESCISRIPMSYDFSQGTHNFNPRTEPRQAHVESVLEWEGASEGGTSLSVNIQFSGDSGFPLNPKTLLCRRTLVSQNNSRRRTVAPNSFLKIRIFSALAPLKPELFTSSLVLYLFSSRLTSGYSKIRKAPWLHLPPTPIIGSWTEISPFKRMALLEHLASFHILFSLGRAV